MIILIETRIDEVHKDWLGGYDNALKIFRRDIDSKKELSNLHDNKRDATWLQASKSIEVTPHSEAVAHYSSLALGFEWL